MKRNRSLAVAALAIMIATGVLLAFWRTHQRLGQPGVAVGPWPIYDTTGTLISDQSVLLPVEVNGTPSTNVPITKLELSVLPADTSYGRRLYRQPDGFSIQLSVVLMGTDRTSLHKPEFCMPSQGWTIDEKNVVPLSATGPSGAYQLPVMKWLMTARGRNSAGQAVTVRGYYAFWFVSDDSLTPWHAGRMWSIVGKLLKKRELERWAYVSYFCSFPPGGETEASARLDKFIVDSVPKFQTVRLASGAASP